MWVKIYKCCQKVKTVCKYLNSWFILGGYSYIVIYEFKKHIFLIILHYNIETMKNNINWFSSWNVIFFQQTPKEIEPRIWKQFLRKSWILPKVVWEKNEEHSRPSFVLVWRTQYYIFINKLRNRRYTITVVELSSVREHIYVDSVQRELV